MKIAITGSNGYLGRHIVNEALERGHEVVSIDRDNSSVDIFDTQQNMFDALEQPDVLLHLAWRDGFKHNSDAHMGDLSSHYNFLENFMANGGRRVAVMGSMHEIGYWEGAIDENTPCNPLSHYGIAKNALRQSAQLLAAEHDAQLYWLRGFYIYGDDAGGNSIFSKIVQAVSEDKKEFPFTTGKNKYDFLPIEEFARRAIAAVTQDEITGVINICSGKPVSLAEQVEDYIKSNNYDIALKYGAFPDRPYDSPCVYGDDTKITQILENETTR